MFYAPELIHTICSQGDVNDRGYRTTVIERCYPNPQDRKAAGTLIEFLRHMPPPEKQRKIIDALTRETERRGHAITGMRWWDIVPAQRNLVATVMRDGHAIPAQFFWRSPKDHAPLNMQFQAAWAPNRDPASAFPYRLDVEAGPYDQMIATYAGWLDRPLAFPAAPAPRLMIARAS